MTEEYVVTDPNRVITKFELMPYVMVYRHAFHDINEILDCVKNSEINSESFTIDEDSDEDKYKYFRAGGKQEDDYHDLNFEYKNQNKFYIRNWSNWYTFGNKTEIRPYIHSNKETEDDVNAMVLEYTPEEAKRWRKEKDVIKQIQKAMTKTLEDYESLYEAKDIFPSYVNNWNINSTTDGTEKGHWDMRSEHSAADILKHNAETDGDYAISWHTDRRASTESAPGARPIITITIYLNDDYEGGEVSYLREEDNSIITYKPKAGDIVIFPSGKPFYHAARKVSKNNKYLLRQFVTWDYVGDPEWLSNLEKHGEDKWLEMESERTQIEDRQSAKVIISGEDYKSTVLNGSNYTVYINGNKYFVDKANGFLRPENKDLEVLGGTPYLLREEKYIDGRDYDI